MNHGHFEVLSNQAVAACSVLYFLALLAQLVAAVNRTPVAAKELVASDGAAVAGGAEAGVDDTKAENRERAYRSDLYDRVALGVTVVAAFVHFLALVFRGLAADPIRVPWGNMYEFTLTGTFVVMLFYLVAHKKLGLGWMAPIVTIFVLATLMVDVRVLYEPITPLQDALQSPWLIVHVVAAIIATGAYTMGGICSILYLFKAHRPHTTRGYLSRVPAPEQLERTAYRFHAFAFPLWTFAALIAGPIWAQKAWGSYWNWDPKEVWAFITWVVYAGYLHARSTAGWKGTRSSIIALVGLGTLWFNFIGINFFFGDGSMHSYAVEVVTHTLR